MGQMSQDPGQRPRVLVVDDEQRLTDLLRLELDVEGYEVDISNDGASGLIRSRCEPAPDLIILDWNLPDFSGIDICQRMRVSGVHTPILMLTGNDDVHDRVTALDAGVDDYLIKPFSIDELMARLRAMHRRADILQTGNGWRPRLSASGRRLEDECSNAGCNQSWSEHSAFRQGI